MSWLSSIFLLSNHLQHPSNHRTLWHHNRFVWLSIAHISFRTCQKPVFYYHFSESCSITLCYSFVCILWNVFMVPKVSEVSVSLELMTEVVDIISSSVVREKRREQRVSVIWRCPDLCLAFWVSKNDLTYTHLQPHNISPSFSLSFISSWFLTRSPRFCQLACRQQSLFYVIYKNVIGILRIIYPNVSFQGCRFCLDWSFCI